MLQVFDELEKIQRKMFETAGYFKKEFQKILYCHLCFSDGSQNVLEG